VTAFHRHQAPFGFYMQMRNGLPYSGVAVFTGNLDPGPGTPFNLQVGDSVVVYGKVQHFSDAEPLAGGVIGTLTAQVDLLVRVVTSGTPEPPQHVGTLAEFDASASNPVAPRWTGMLVRLPGPLEVVSSGDTKTFLVVDPSCTGTACDTVVVDGNSLAD